MKHIFTLYLYLFKMKEQQQDDLKIQPTGCAYNVERRERPKSSFRFHIRCDPMSHSLVIQAEWHSPEIA